MEFGKKVRLLRKKARLSQTELGNLVGVSMRSVRGWEAEGRFPLKNSTYDRLAEIFDCPVEYLMDDSMDDYSNDPAPSFTEEVTKEYGSRAGAQAQQILDSCAALFAGGELSEEDKIAFLYEIQGLFLDSKNRAKKYAPNAYKDDSEND